MPPVGSIWTQRPVRRSSRENIYRVLGSMGQRVIVQQASVLTMLDGLHVEFGSLVAYFDREAFDVDGDLKELC